MCPLPVSCPGAFKALLTIWVDSVYSVIWGPESRLRKHHPLLSSLRAGSNPADPSLLNDLQGILLALEQDSLAGIILGG